MIPQPYHKLLVDLRTKTTLIFSRKTFIVSRKSSIFSQESSVFLHKIAHLLHLSLPVLVPAIIQEIYQSPACIYKAGSINKDLSSAGRHALDFERDLGRYVTCKDHHFSTEESSFSIEESLKNLYFLLKNHHLNL